MTKTKKLFFDYGGLIANYDFNKGTLFRAHRLALDYLNSLNGHKINLTQLAKAHEQTIQTYLTARKDSSEWRMNKIMRLLLSNLGLNSNMPVSKVSEIYKQNDHDSTPYPDTKRVLTELAINRTLGIISNLPHDSLIYELKRDKLLDLFETVTISFEVGVRKPHPKIYQEALRKAKVTPAESFFISHDKEEVRGARQLGIESLLVKSIKEVIGAV